MENVLRSCEVCEGSRFSSLFDKCDHHFERCAHCGLERIEPQPTNEILAQVYGKHYYDAWGLDRDEASVGQLKRATFSYVLDQLPPARPGARLLDCGAATGFLLELAKERGFVPYGIELSEFGAGEIARKFGKGHSFQGEIENARFPDANEGDFSVITMCDYVEHVRKPRQVLERARKLLRSDGVLALTTPDTGSLTHHVLAKGWSHYKVEHLHYFSRDNLKMLLGDVGFAQVEFRPLWKTLNVRYIQEQFRAFPHPVLSVAARALGKAVPGTLQDKHIRVLTGELLAIARVTALS